MTRALEFTVCVLLMVLMAVAAERATLELDRVIGLAAL